MSSVEQFRIAADRLLALLPLSDLNDWRDYAMDYVAYSGGLMRTANLPDASDVIEPVGFTLLPSPFPKDGFEKAKRLQLPLQELICKSASDPEFLLQVLQPSIDGDEFTARLWKLHEEVRETGAPQRIHLGLTRNDFMLHQEGDAKISIKQVEYNMTAVSLGGLDPAINKWHDHLLRCLGHDVADEKLAILADNKPVFGFAKAMLQAVSEYERIYAVSGTAVLVVPDTPNRNTFDQRGVEFAVRQLEPTRRTIKRTMLQLHDALKLSDGVLTVDGVEVALVYWRTAYDPSLYRCEADWTVRTAAEKSRAVKNMSIAQQLVNYKLVQQAFGKTEVLRKFCVPDEVAAEMMTTFMSQLTLEFSSDGNANLQEGLAHPDDYVLKPQREGGGHNMYGDEMVQFLHSVARERASASSNSEAPERGAYILMGKIRPPMSPNFAVAPHLAAVRGNYSCELGIYGHYLAVDGKLLYNEEDGYLVRSKVDGVNEVGIAAGFGRLDTPCLF